jgi:hypothetical protein
MCITFLVTCVGSLILRKKNLIWKTNRKLTCCGINVVTCLLPVSSLSLYILMTALVLNVTLALRKRIVLIPVAVGTAQC